MPIIIGNLSQFWSFCDEDLDGNEGVVYDWGGNRNYKRQYKVGVVQKEMGPIQVALCPLLPREGSIYSVVSPITGNWETDTQALLTKRSAVPLVKGDRQIWLVKDEYSTVLPGNQRTNDPHNASKDPEQELAEINWDFEDIQDSPHMDLNGNCYVTTAQQPMTPAPQFPMACPVVTISRNELNFNYDKASFYARALNDATFLLAPPNCVQLAPAKAVQKNRGTFRYWRTTYKLVFRPQQAKGGYILPPTNIILPQYAPDGSFSHYNPFPNKGDLVDSWQPRPLMQGMYRLGQAGKDMLKLVGKPIPIFKHGHLVNHPILLDDQGQESVASDPATDSTIPAWYKEFRRFRNIDINKLLVEGLS